MANLKMADFSNDVDLRGDFATFIETRHFVRNPWDDLDAETKKRFKGCQPTFFRVIHNGVQQSGHGWIEDGEIVQWG